MTGVCITAEYEMTWRARFYLTVAALRHTLTGVVALTMPVLPGVDLGLPLWAWGLVFILGGCHLGYAAAAGREGHARAGLAISAVMTSVFAAGFLALWLDGESGPLGAILFTALTLKDLTIVRDPMRSPFEPIVREYADQDPG